MTGGDPSAGPVRYSGTVARLLDEFGFIASDELENDLYFRPSWFRGGPLAVGDMVTFEIKTFGDRRQAHNILRTGGGLPSERSPAAGLGPPVSDRIFQWAYLGYLPRVLSSLAEMALPERWEFKDAVQDPERPLPILHSYVIQTFARLVLEEKVVVSASGRFAAFNTGLVDPRYEPIYALMVPNDSSESPVPWRLSSFCVAGEGMAGQNLVRHFNPLPAGAHYFDEPSDLLYDVRVGKPEMDWKHVVVDRIGRYPSEFVEDNWPSGLAVRDTASMSAEERAAYWASVGAAIESDTRTYRGIMNRIRDAVDLSVKRVGWNFKTAVPQYYPRVKKLQLLLPINLVSDDEADMALTVERTPSGSYLGHTVLALDWAYKNARLICRPDSDWLEAAEISEEGPEEESGAPIAEESTSDDP